MPRSYDDRPGRDGGTRWRVELGEPLVVAPMALAQHPEDLVALLAREQPGEPGDHGRLQIGDRVLHVREAGAHLGAHVAETGAHVGEAGAHLGAHVAETGTHVGEAGFEVAVHRVERYLGIALGHRLDAITARGLRKCPQFQTALQRRVSTWPVWPRSAIGGNARRFGPV
jgi:hypothetical protein